MKRLLLTAHGRSLKMKNKKEKKTILYICDRQKCIECSYPACQHTSDIDHAVSFKKLRTGDYWELPTNDEEATDEEEI